MVKLFSFSFAAFFFFNPFSYPFFSPVSREMLTPHGLNVLLLISILKWGFRKDY